MPMLSIKDSISTFMKGTDADKFALVLDGVNQMKQTEISNALRIFNPILQTDTKWIAKRLTDYGFFVSQDYPWQPLQALLMNVHSVTRLKGTKVGIKALLMLLTLGDITIDTTNFVSTPDAIYPDAIDGDGYITGNDTTNSQRYIVNDRNVYEPPRSLTISISSIYANNSVVKTYVETLIKDWITVAPNLTLIINWSLATAKTVTSNSIDFNNLSTLI